MNTPTIMRQTLRVTLFATALLAVPALPALAANPRGYVDAEPFVAFVPEEGKLVEVNISNSMMKAFAKSLASDEDKDTAQLMGKLHSIRAVIAGIEPGRVEAAVKLVESTASKLRGEGWEEMARVRSKDARIRVLMLNDNGQVSGLVVLLVDKSGDTAKGKHHKNAAADEDGDDEDGPSLIFANIAGNFTVDDVGKLTGKLDVPGFDRLRDGKDEKEKDATKPGDGKPGKTPRKGEEE